MGLFQHPATRFTCRHCGKDAGYDPEMCFRCGPVCGDCFVAADYPCEKKDKLERRLLQLLHDERLDWHLDGDTIDAIEHFSGTVEGEEEFLNILKERLRKSI